MYAHVDRSRKGKGPSAVRRDARSTFRHPHRHRPRLMLIPAPLIVIPAKAGIHTQHWTQPILT